MTDAGAGLAGAAGTAGVTAWVCGCVVTGGAAATGAGAVVRAGLGVAPTLGTIAGTGAVGVTGPSDGGTDRQVRDRQHDGLGDRCRWRQHPGWRWSAALRGPW